VSCDADITREQNERMILKMDHVMTKQKNRILILSREKRTISKVKTESRRIKQEKTKNKRTTTGRGGERGCLIRIRGVGAMHSWTIVVDTTKMKLVIEWDR
jgi:hypothetical protein